MDAIRPVALAIFDWTKNTLLPTIIDNLIANFNSIKDTFVAIFASFEGWSDMTFKEKLEAIKAEQARKEKKLSKNYVRAKRRIRAMQKK